MDGGTNRNEIEFDTWINERDGPMKITNLQIMYETTPTKNSFSTSTGSVGKARKRSKQVASILTAAKNIEKH